MREQITQLMISEWRGGGVVGMSVLYKVLYGEALPQGPAPYHFDRYPFVTFY